MNEKQTNKKINKNSLSCQLHMTVAAGCWIAEIIFGVNSTWICETFHLVCQIKSHNLKTSVKHLFCVRITKIL